jgi:hypothetical protein
MSLLLANNATSTLAAGISNSDTSLTVRTGDGAKFPALNPGDWFPVTLMNMADGTVEICRATARSGDTFTIERAMEGTPPAAFPSGSLVQLRLTAGALGSLILERTALIPNLFWLTQPLGVPIPIFAHLFDGVLDGLPPKDDPRFRYVYLVAGVSSYNDPVLINETVTGSSPEITATAQINDPGSPFHGKTIHLIGTERRFLRASSGSQSGTVAFSQNKSHNHAASTNSAGAHTHSVSGTTNSTGSHNHDISTRPNAGDSGGFRKGAGANITPLESTQNAGLHSHSVSGTAASAGAHTHTVTVSNSGEAEAYPTYITAAYVMRIR